MTDEHLARWAARRAPELLARAEAEAVAALRDALVSAACGERITRHRGKPASLEPAEPKDATAGEESGELLWAYCVLRTSDPSPTDLSGVDPARPVERVQDGGLAALVSRVPRSEFGPDPLRRNLNDLAWLERVARAHEAVLDHTLTTHTIVPLRMCTLFENRDGVHRMLQREQDTLVQALATLEGHLEWGIKVLVDRDRLAEEARERDDRASRIAAELDQVRGDGGAYLVRRRLERELRDLTDSLATQIAEEVHARLQDWAIDAVVRPPQNRDLSHHQGEMLLNAAYLVDANRIDELRSIVSELEERYRELGVQIELTGPWPPYNFTPHGGTAALA